MVKVVSWNIGKREKPWRELVVCTSAGAGKQRPRSATGPLGARSLDLGPLRVSCWLNPRRGRW